MGGDTSWKPVFSRVDEGETLSSRLSVLSIIFCVSLFAVSFPTLSRRVRFIRIPRIVFFIGKHFGTGVILSTAFVHLLQDAFECLQDPVIRQRWPVSDYVGLIVLSSLLFIFFVEYISTSYVDSLQSYSSPPSTPASPNQTLTPPASSFGHTVQHEELQIPIQIQIDNPAEDRGREEAESLANQGVFPLPETPELEDEGAMAGETQREEEEEDLNERTPLVQPKPRGMNNRRSLPRSFRYPTQTQIPTPNPYRSSHSHFHPNRNDNSQLLSRPQLQSLHPGQGEEEGEGDPYFAGGHHRHEPRSRHASHAHPGLGRMKSVRSVLGVDGGREEVLETNGHAHHHSHLGGGGGHGHGGHGHGHTHGFGWDDEDGGIEDGWGGADGDVEESEEGRVGRKRQVVGILVLQLGIMLHSLVIGLTLAITSGGGFTSLVFAIIFHQLFEGLSLGIRIASLPVSSHHHSHNHSNAKIDDLEETRNNHNGNQWFMRFLKPMLVMLFAVTTPAGILIGLGVFGSGASEGPEVQLTRGLMSAISAGMLIYSATVEMLAADFVMDPASWRGGVWKQVVALGSLVVGMVGMSVIGFD